MHSTFSDGKAEPGCYIDDAIRAGMKEIGFSEL
jgi:histidinol phosphatase-like PHP family hydrolase